MQLVRALVVFGLLSTALSACTPDREEPVLSVLALRPWLGSAVVLDGKEVAVLAETRNNTGLMGAVTRTIHPDSPLRDLVAVNLAISTFGIEEGQHEIKLVRGNEEVVANFAYPFRDRERHCSIFFTEASILVNDQCRIEEPGQQTHR